MPRKTKVQWPDIHSKPPLPEAAPRDLIAADAPYKTLNLAALIRKIAYETTDPSTLETRLEAAIRGMWTRAQVDPSAFSVLTDRGWGKVPQAVQVTIVGAALIEHAENLGLRPDHVLADPALLSLFKDGGVEVIDGEFRVVDVDVVI